MNAKQQATVDTLIAKITATTSRIGLTEVKQQVISEAVGLVFLTIEMGMPGDEGTAAAILCRDYRHIMIGVAGGCELLNSAKPKTSSRGIFHCVNNMTK